MLNSLDASEWQEVQKLDLCPGIDTPEQYINKVTEGLAKATVEVFKDPRSVPDIAYIQMLHRDV